MTKGSFLPFSRKWTQTLSQRWNALQEFYLLYKIQGTVADVLKAIIAISANSSDAGVIGPNALSRELVSEATINRILDYMLDPDAPFSTASLTNGVSLIIELIRKNNR